MRRASVAVVVAAVLTAGTAGPAAGQTPAPDQRAKIVFVGGPVGVVRATGFIDAVGVALEQTTLNPDGTFTGTLTFLFPLGTITAPYAGVVTSVTVDPLTCTGRFATAGTFQVAAATGFYVGTAGSGTFTESGIFNAVPTGAGCSPDLQVRTYLTTDATASLTRSRA
jgi:uncharacterized ion transporter superfamily protein YfcC